MKIYLFSDAHFGVSDEEEIKFRKFKKLLEEVKKNASKFIIIGDLFDFWFEYNSVIFSHYFKVLFEIYKISNDIEIIYIAGNHDLWIGNFIQNLNIKAVIGKYEINLNNKKIIFAHGDDLKFRIKTRDFLKNRFLVNIFKSIHPDIGIKIAKFVSRISRKAHNNNLKEIPDWLWNYFNKVDGDVLIIGHLHLPTYSIRNNKKIACIGDWLEHYTYGIIDEDKLSVLQLEGKIIYTLNL